MGYRKSKQKAEAKRAWATFLEGNKELIFAAGLPELVTESVEHWDDFLMHGFLDHHEDPSRFSVDQLSERQYGSFLQLVERYFGSGYEYFEPVAVQVEGSRRLKDLYGGERYR